MEQLSSQLEEAREQRGHYELEYRRLQDQCGGRPATEIHQCDESHLSELLGRTERELFEARTELEAKVGTVSMLTLFCMIQLLLLGTTLR